MTMAETEDDMQRLNALFDQARSEKSEIPEGLRARILADASLCRQQQQVQNRQNVAPAPVRAALAGVFDRSLNAARQFLRAVGGWPAMGGMVAATVAGVWIGLAPPEFVPDPVDLVQVATTAAAMPFENYDLALLLDEEME